MTPGDPCHRLTNCTVKNTVCRNRDSSQSLIFFERFIYIENPDTLHVNNVWLKWICFLIQQSSHRCLIYIRHTFYLDNVNLIYWSRYWVCAVHWLICFINWHMLSYRQDD